jgi:ABC-2 type transport system permease protein
MLAITPDTIAGPDAGSRLPRRPPLLVSVIADATLGVGTYPASYWLRFTGDQLAQFLPGAWSTLPFVVSCQLLGLVLLRAYAPDLSRGAWFVRVTAGVTAGTAASGALVGLILGFSGVSRIAFVADAMLLSIAALGWRGVWALRVRARRGLRLPASSPDLVDRTEEMTTLRAIVASMYSYREFLKNLVLKDLKLKYRGSVFGFLWSLVNPLLMIVVYTIAFTYILRVRAEGFVFYVMLGLLSWTYFANSAAMSTGAIIDNSGLLKSAFFPRAILPIATVLFNLAQYLLTVAVFFPVMLLWYRVPISGSMMLFPVFLALQSLFTIGIALILATSTAFFRDVRHLLEVALQVMFWTTPIVYELGQVPEKLRLLILLSPMSPFVVGYQKLFYFREWPEPTLWLVTVTYSLGTFIVGAALLLAFEDRFAEQV